MRFFIKPLSAIFFTILSKIPKEAIGEDICDQTDDVTFVTNDIFDLSDKDTIFLHEWANFFHIKTKNITLLNESAFFLDKCQISKDDLQELERHLRSKKYIRNASVKYNEDNKVEVTTWDNWSLLPTASFGRKGGSNTFSVGIKDRNLLGLGIDTELEYYSNDQRTGYAILTQFPLFLNNNINANIRFSNNDDGTSEAIFLQKKFVSFDTKNAFNVGFDNFNQTDTQYENGIESNQYAHQQVFSTVSWHWLHRNSSKNTLRFGAGYTNEEHNFLTIPDSTIVSTIPKNRKFNYPFLSVDYLQKDYRKLINLNLINHIEDFNLGWNATANIGSDLSSNEGAPTLIWQSNVSKGIDILENSFLFFEANFEGEIYRNSDEVNRLLFSFNTSYFHKFNESWGAYFNNRNVLSKNQFIDTPIVLGGETGIRGFPLQYQHGKQSTQYTFEARYYPHINIYKLLELGAAAFVDTGRVFGQSELSQNQSPWMTSIGLGARFYSTHSSEARVIHVDIIKPITADPNVNSIEFRLTTKHSF